MIIVYNSIYFGTLLKLGSSSSSNPEALLVMSVLSFNVLAFFFELTIFDEQPSVPTTFIQLLFNLDID